MAKRKSGIYIYRTRKPGAVFGVWFFGRHFAYVGETLSFYHRGKQHLLGGGNYDVKAKDWSDLKPKCYRIPLPPWKWLLRSGETLVISLTWPVYNIQKNLWNPRRISPARARAQRLARDTKNWPLRIITATRPMHVFSVITIAYSSYLWMYR